MQKNGFRETGRQLPNRIPALPPKFFDKNLFYTICAHFIHFIILTCLVFQITFAIVLTRFFSNYFFYYETRSQNLFKQHLWQNLVFVFLSLVLDFFVLFFLLLFVYKFHTHMITIIWPRDCLCYKNNFKRREH